MEYTTIFTKEEIEKRETHYPNHGYSAMIGKFFTKVWFNGVKWDAVLMTLEFKDNHWQTVDEAKIDYRAWVKGAHTLESACGSMGEAIAREIEYERNLVEYYPAYYLKKFGYVEVK